MRPQTAVLFLILAACAGWAVQTPAPARNQAGPPLLRAQILPTWDIQWGGPLPLPTATALVWFANPVSERDREAWQSILPYVHKLQRDSSFYLTVLPDRTDEKSMLAAELAFCSSNRRAAAVIGFLIQVEHPPQPNTLMEQLRHSDVDMDGARSCMATGGYKTDLEAALAQADSLGITSTPAFFVGSRNADRRSFDGVVLQGDQPFSEIQAALDAAAARARATPK